MIFTWWFGDAHDETPLVAGSPYLTRWFGGSKDLDNEIRANFGELHAQAAAWQLSAWADTARGRQALVLLYDQFTRALYRGTPRVFEFDRRAQSLARRALAGGLTLRLPLIQQLFMTVPLGRSEQIEDQEMYLDWFQYALGEAKSRRLPTLAFWTGGAERAKAYYDIIHKFGRFPQRNAILKRETTEAESDFVPLELDSDDLHSIR